MRLAGTGTRTCATRPPTSATRSTRRSSETGAPSVDLVGYSAGGVVVRLYVADLGGGSHVRRAVTLASPHHGTDLAALAGSLGSEACPEACQQLDPDSDLLRRLNAGDETPGRPGLGGALDRGRRDRRAAGLRRRSTGALDFSVQSVCPGLVVAPRGRAPDARR